MFLSQTLFKLVLKNFYFLQFTIDFSVKFGAKTSVALKILINNLLPPSKTLQFIKYTFYKFISAVYAPENMVQINVNHVLQKSMVTNSCLQNFIH